MTVFIDNRSGTPIYEQIYSQIKGQILRGELPPDTALPSIRGLAKDLNISVITTKRAYDELEREGFIYTMAGKGSYVSAQSADLLREENRRQLEELLRQALHLAALCGLSRQELVDILDILEEE